MVLQEFVSVGKRSDPKGSMRALDFQTIVAETEATISFSLLRPAFWSTVSDGILSFKQILVMVLAALFIEQFILSVSVIAPYLHD